MRSEVSSPTTECGVCKRPIDVAVAVYNKNGDLICTDCNASDQIAEGDRRAVSSLVGGAFGPLVLGCIALVFNLFFCMTLLAMLAGMAWLRATSQAPRFRGWKYQVCLALVLVGMALALHPLWSGLVAAHR